MGRELTEFQLGPGMPGKILRTICMKLCFGTHLKVTNGRIADLKPLYL
jgi:hypothetical protein